MSIILEALRKSEAARRRSEAPDVFATMPSTAARPHERRRPPVWGLAIAASLAALVSVIAIWSLRGEPKTDIAPPHDRQAQNDSSGARIMPSTPTMQAPTPITPADAPTTPASMRPPFAVTPSPPTAVPAPTLAVKEPPAAPRAVIASDPVPSPPASEPAVISPPAPTTTPTQTPALSDHASPPRSDSNEQPVRVSDLDPGTRRQLPPLKLSMHLWDETPSRRFLIIDGQRLKEGDLHGEVVIERIEREGAIVVWRGVRMRIGVR